MGTRRLSLRSLYAARLAIAVLLAACAAPKANVGPAKPGPIRSNAAQHDGRGS